MLIFVMGAPGSGKGTLCRKLCQDFGYSHLSIGDHLRELVRTRSETLNQHIIDNVQRNALLPVDDLEVILRDAVAQLERKGAEVIIVDGYPRHHEQVEPEGGTAPKPELVLFFDCEREIARSRYLTRALPGRDNDEEVFSKRYEEYVRLNPPLIQTFTEEGILLKINTSTDTPCSYEELVRVVRAAHPRLCRPIVDQTDEEIEAEY